MKFEFMRKCEKLRKH